MLVGYARISTEKQDLNAQLDLLKLAGCTKIFTDVYTGSKCNRPNFDKMLSFVRKGDCICVYKLDRFSRSLKDLIIITNELKEKGIDFKSLNEKIDTSSPEGKLFFHIIGAFAEYEINIIRERTKAGLASARSRGRIGGRPKKMTDEKVKMAKSLHANKDLKVKDICKELDVGRCTFYKMINM
ncbi:MAG TPA: recombinase family protein [Candidatus Atribacteria bacterium]|nr:recombinase family protein [Candidatus Atribacteria bacterium]